MTNIQILHNYKHYEKPILGLFNASVKGELLNSKKLIIGETDNHYVYEHKKVIHKSRLIEWIPTQLRIF